MRSRSSGGSLPNLFADFGQLSLAPQRLDAHGFHVERRRACSSCSDAIARKNRGSWSRQQVSPHYSLGSVRFQIIDHRLLRLGQRQVERGLIVFGARVCTSAPAATSALRHFQIAALRGGVQRSPAAMLAGVDAARRDRSEA